MRAGLIAVVLLNFAAGGALASAYSDFNAGVAAHNREDWDESVTRLSAAIDAPDLAQTFRVPAYIDRGDAHAARREWKEAIADYSSALAIKPGSLEGLMHRAAIYEAERKYGDAIGDYAQVVSLRPSMAMGYEGRASTYDDANNLDAAIADYSAAIAIDPRNAADYTLRGSAYRRQGNFQKAIADQNRAIDIDSKSPQIYFERAQTYQDEGEYHHAIADNMNGLRMRPADTDGRLQLGLSLWAYGRFADAAAAFTQLVDQRPTALYSVLWLAVAEARAGQDYKTDLANRAAKLDLDKWPAPLVKLYLGRAEMRDVADAAGADRASIKNRMCEVDFYDAELNLLKGDKGAARPQLEAAVANCPREFIEHDAASAELQRLK
ncbi:MAG TPA: tetratricopeptide repeat protein [Rhizomicrobium sp.]|jgi:tetratricopeptide (TPR) repeat protein